MEQKRQEQACEPTGREHGGRALVQVVYCWLGIMAIICVYFLSFGPVLRFAARPVSLPIRSPTGNAMVMARGVSYAAWVTVLYGPAFYVVGNDPRPEYGHHDLLNTYKRYLQWWTP